MNLHHSPAQSEAVHACSFADLGFALDGFVAIKAPRELVKSTLSRDGVTFIGGQSGAGKTFVAVDLSTALATGPGAEFFGRPVRERIGVAYLVAEGEGMIAARIEAARRHRGIAGTLPIVWRSVGNLSDSRIMRETCQKLTTINALLLENFGVPLGAVFIDTVAASFSMKDENDNAEASRIVAALQQMGRTIGALILPVHHYGKSETTGLRGASAFRANADGLISVNATRNEITGKVTNRTAAIAKYRDGEEGEIGGFDLTRVTLGEDEYGDPWGSCAVTPNQAATSTRTARINPRLKLGLDALMSMVADRGTSLPPSWQMPMGLKSVPLIEWRNEVFSRGILDKGAPNPRQPFHRMKSELMARGFIAEREDRVWPVTDTVTPSHPLGGV